MLIVFSEHGCPLEIQGLAYPTRGFAVDKNIGFRCYGLAYHLIVTSQLRIVFQHVTEVCHRRSRNAAGLELFSQMPLGQALGALRYDFVQLIFMRFARIVISEACIVSQIRLPDDLAKRPPLLI